MNFFTQNEMQCKYSMLQYMKNTTSSYLLGRPTGKSQIELGQSCVVITAPFYIRIRIALRTFVPQLWIEVSHMSVPSISVGSR
jgi:hypothetical protein